MKFGFYQKLAIDGIQKNKKLYYPYLFTCTFMVTIFYIVKFLATTPVLLNMRGGENVQMIMGLGMFVIGIFSIVFLIYTNSFLMRRRKKEFGLYNVLGMNKRNIGRVLFWETTFVALWTTTLGILIGLLLSKLAELGLMNVINGKITYTFSFSISSILQTYAGYIVIHFVILMNSIRQIAFASPSKLVKEENAGEKQPKANWILGLGGLVLLGVAYYIAISIQDPLSALIYFFIAVIIVIIATYLIMMAGSVLLCRLLQKNKKYYYNKKHFISVSSMAYRMKRNGAGLASICILSTMVLVTISSTTCLFFGSQSSLDTRYPRDIVLEYRMDDMSESSMDAICTTKTEIERYASKKNFEISNVLEYKTCEISGLLQGNSVLVFEPEGMYSYNNLVTVSFESLEDFNQYYGMNETLEDGQALVYQSKSKFKEDTMTIEDFSISVKKEVDVKPKEDDSVITTIHLVVQDLDSTIVSIQQLKTESGQSMLLNRWVYAFDTNVDADQQVVINHDIGNIVCQLDLENVNTIYWNSREEEKGDFYGTFGGFFFVGILLSVAFMVGAVLIIYYKQVCEGYEDQSRFAIMQKVGMTKQDIKQSINSQLLTIFYLPLVMAILHLGFAFPMIRNLLLLFGLTNLTLLIKTTIISIAVFGVFYAITYKITSNTYYEIVSEMN